MPKFVGNTIDGVDVTARRPDSRYVELTYSQACKMSPQHVVAVLNTSDRGGPGSRAKRWHNWFALATDVMENPYSTSNMRGRAARQLAGALVVTS